MVKFRPTTLTGHSISAKINWMQNSFIRESFYFHVWFIFIEINSMKMVSTLTVGEHFFLFVRWDFEYCGHYWPIVPAPDDRWGWLWRNWWNEDWQGKPKYSEETCPSATLSTRNSTWLDPGLNPGRRGGKPATNRLIYDAAVWEHVCFLQEMILKHKLIL
jgi:hypothetical protein